MADSKTQDVHMIEIAFEDINERDRAADAIEKLLVGMWSKTVWFMSGRSVHRPGDAP